MRFGKPVAEIVPPSPDAGQKSWIGSMKDTMDIIGDIVSPLIDEKRYRGAARLKLLLDTHVWLFPQIGSLPPLPQVMNLTLVTASDNLIRLGTIRTMKN